MLAFLTLGYCLGGRLADSRPQRRLLAQVLLVAALSRTCGAKASIDFTKHCSKRVPVIA